jgi:hypothetical protein
MKCSIEIPCQNKPPWCNSGTNVIPWRTIVSLYVEFEVFTAVTLKNAVFWDVEPFRSCSSETSVHFTGSTRRHNPEYGIIYSKFVISGVVTNLRRNLLLLSSGQMWPRRWKQQVSLKPTKQNALIAEKTSVFTEVETPYLINVDYNLQKDLNAFLDVFR